MSGLLCSTKYTIRWNEKRLHNKSDISGLYANYTEMYKNFPTYCIMYDKIHFKLEQKTPTK